MKPEMIRKLIAEAIGGDEAAFANVYSALQPEVERVLQGWWRYRRYWDDLSQETWLRALRRWMRSREVPDDPKAWIKRIAANVCIDWHRKMMAERGGAERRGIMAADSEGVACEAIIPGQMLELMHKCLDEIEFRILAMKFFQGHSYREIASALGLTPEQVKYRVYKAKDKLKREYAKELQRSGR